MTHPLHFGATLPQIKRTWEETRSAAETFEAVGFDSLWVCDHVYGVPRPDLPILEAWSTLAAVAALTERAELGTLVTPPFFRNPAMLAKTIASVDQIAGGRVIAGLGAGWFEAEFQAYGCPFPSLRERMWGLEETAHILRSLWSEPRTSFDGRLFQVQDAICEPKPARRTPILIGGGGEKVLMGIAAKHADIWNNLAVFQGQLGQKVEALRKRCGELGRDPSEIVVSQQCTVVIGEDDASARAALEKAHKVFGGHMGAALEEHGIWGDPGQVVERIQRHVELGCSMFVIEFFGRDTREPARLFAEKVIPALR